MVTPFGMLALREGHIEKNVHVLVVAIRVHDEIGAQRLPRGRTRG